jgi:hypothetical protein
MEKFKKALKTHKFEEQKFRKRESVLSVNKPTADLEHPIRETASVPSSSSSEQGGVGDIS